MMSKSCRLKRWKALLCGIVLASCALGTANETELQRGIKLLKENKLKEAEQVLLPLTNKNNANACYELGTYYIQKMGNLEKGVSYLKKSSDLGNLNAKYFYALMLSEGYGTKKNIPEAIKLLRVVADLSEDQDACFQAGRLMLLLEPDQQGLQEALGYMEKAARPNPKAEKKEGNKIAQLMAGMIYMDMGNYKKAFFYLEASAEQNCYEAWRKLGVMYHKGTGIKEPNLEWAKYCYLAEYRISGDPECAFNIGVLESERGDLDEAMKWMKIAADKKYKQAADFLKDKEVQKIVLKIKKQIPAPKDPLGENLDFYFSMLSKHFGKDGEKALNIAGSRPKAPKKDKMIRLPHPENIRMSGWIYDKEKTLQMMHKQLIRKRDGFYCPISDEFKKQPLEKNLEVLNPAIRWINSNYEEAIVSALSKSIYPRIPQKETDAIIKKMDPEQVGSNRENKMWKITDKVYFNIYTDFDGRWHLRYYQFIVVGKKDVFLLATFDTPPSTYEADTIFGIANTNLDCLNNYGVLVARKSKSNLMQNGEEIEVVFQTLAENKHYEGTYNLAVFYEETGKKELAEIYYKLAEKLKKEKK